MKRLSIRLFVTHVVVALVGGIVTALISRMLMPRFADPPSDLGAADTALLLGAATGVLLALILGLLLSWRLLAPLREMQQVTKQVASGDYRLAVARPATAEFAALADDVNALAGALASTDARRVRLISEVTEEMRAPLTAIDGAVAEIREGGLVIDGDRLGQISAEVRRLRRLTEDVSTLSRVEEGHLELELADVDLAGLVREVAERATPHFEEAGVQLHSLVTGKLVAHADAEQLSRIVGNLLSNALRATRERSGGEVLLGIARTNEAGRAVARLTVTDNGVGLSADELAQIFERFYRAPNARDTEGSGIGLTIARDIVRAHGGELTANSPGQGKGATLTLTLPLL